MNCIRFCVFVVFLCVCSIHNTQSYDFNQCPTGENDFLNVTFGSLNIECNTKYDRELVSLSPNITFPHAAQEKFYEVVMIDPDAPSASDPKCRSWLHLLLSDVKRLKPLCAFSSGKSNLERFMLFVPLKGSDLQKGIAVNDAAHNIITEYNPPTPPKSTGYHRYIQAVFGHAKQLKLKMRISQRCGFDIDLFIETHKLKETPDANNMFQTITKLDRVEKATTEL